MKYDRKLTRREFLRLAASGTALALAGCSPIGGASRTPGPASPESRAASEAAGTPALAHAATAVPTRVAVGALPTAGRITPAVDFYVQSYDEVAQVNLDSWSLTIKGLVREPLQLTWSDLRALPAVEVMRTLECIGNPVGGHLIGNAIWKGVSLAALLDRVGAKPGATHVIMDGADEYFTSLPLAKVQSEQALLAYEMNGAPLTLQHGFPLRALIPGVYGQKQPKWLLNIELTDHYEPGTWEKKGWSDTAAIRVNSRIDEPRSSVSADAERVLISGIAFSDELGIRRIEVSTDDGENWEEATILPGPTPTVWTAWYLWWERPAAGRHALKVRATDGHGHRQGDAAGRLRLLGGAFPNGTSEIHRVMVTVGPGEADG